MIRERGSVGLTDARFDAVLLQCLLCLSSVSDFEPNFFPLLTCLESRSVDNLPSPPPVSPTGSAFELAGEQGRWDFEGALRLCTLADQCACWMRLGVRQHVVPRAPCLTAEPQTHSES